MTEAVDASYCGQWEYMCTTVFIAIFKRSVSSAHLSAGCVLCICFTVEVSEGGKERFLCIT